MFCQFAGVGSGIVVLGGLDRTTWEATRSPVTVCLYWYLAFSFSMQM
uniref:Uncharacterized protein n=1 Tax=Rhizophora mucronata TaxID=61149 RepID=A0A2P2NR44_RHIMU